jgi:hypothetical protein
MQCSLTMVLGYPENKAKKLHRNAMQQQPFSMLYTFIISFIHICPMFNQGYDLIFVSVVIITIMHHQSCRHRFLLLTSANSLRHVASGSSVEEPRHHPTHPNGWTGTHLGLLRWLLTLTLKAVLMPFHARPYDTTGGSLGSSQCAPIGGGVRHPGTEGAVDYQDA